MTSSNLIEPSGIIIRRARVADAVAVTAIYNHGIERGVSYRSEAQTVQETEAWFDTTPFLWVAMAHDAVVGFAASFPSRGRPSEDGVGSIAIYVTPGGQGRGIGSTLLAASIQELAQAGQRKIVTHVLPDNAASRRMLARAGFREVGVLERHWTVGESFRDVVLMERQLG